MKNLLMFVLSGIVLMGVAGCESHMKDVVILPAQGTEQPPQLITVTEKGTYYLYSSKNPRTVIYEKDLKKGDQLGFSIRGDRALALAAGVLIQLDDYSEGTSYVWKIEEKDKDDKDKK